MSFAHLASHAPSRTLAATAAISMLCCAAALRADVVETKDGRRYEGNVVSQNDEIVSIDTLVGDLRITLKLPRIEVASVSKSPLPDGFFRRSTGGDNSRPDEMNSAYLEVPIRGVFGKELFADVIRPALNRARYSKVPHIVFVIDSVEQGKTEDDKAGFDEAIATANLLQSHSKWIQFHSIVKNCVGKAIVFPLHSSTVRLTPGSEIGTNDIPKDWEEARAAEELAIRRQIAGEYGARVAAKRGDGLGALVQALIDPTASFVAWRNDDKTITFGATAPKDVPTTNIILEDDPEKTLRMTYDRAKSLGLSVLDGDTAALGEQLGLKSWHLESNFGSESVNRVTRQQIERQQKAATVFEMRIKENIRRREAVENQIQMNLKAAAEMDPSKGDYSTYGRRWRWGWNGYGSAGGGGTSLTYESQQRWTNRTDATLMYLNRAYSAVVAARKLDKEAAQLGLEQTFKPEELEQMATDLQTKGRMLRLHRNRYEK